jgi:hypothetical protein
VTTLNRADVSVDEISRENQEKVTKAYRDGHGPCPDAKTQTKTKTVADCKLVSVDPSDVPDSAKKPEAEEQDVQGGSGAEQDSKSPENKAKNKAPAKKTVRVGGTAMCIKSN